MHVNIIGYGYVGGAIGHLCKMNDVNFCTYDIVKKTENKALDNFDNIKKLVEFSENNNETNFYFISVPTPSKNSGECNIDIVENVINELNTIITKKTIVIIKSTVQPGTTRKIADNYKNVDIVFCPEFLTEKNFQDDMYNANFVLLGFNEINNESLCNNVSNIMKTLYKHNDKIDVIYKSYEECELFKYTLNVHFAVKVWYFNEISEICDKLNVDYQSLRTLFKLDSRVGNYGTIVPGDHGYGYDGTCLPKEQKGMKYLQNTLDIPNKVLDEIEKRNNYFRTK